MGRSFAPAQSGSRWWEYDMDDDQQINLSPRRHRHDDDQPRRGEFKQQPRRKQRQQPARRRTR